MAGLQFESILPFIVKSCLSLPVEMKVQEIPNGFINEQAGIIYFFLTTCVF